jgi:hypothetical protein
MIIHTTGNMFANQHDICVIPVNCVGVAGAGIALQWKKLHYLVYMVYRDACRKDQIRPGDALESWLPSYWLVATKDHWRDPSKLEWIVACCKNLHDGLENLPPKTIGLPPIGCGLGGLPFDRVEAIVTEVFGTSKHTIHLYAPH